MSQESLLWSLDVLHLLNIKNFTNGPLVDSLLQHQRPMHIQTYGVNIHKRVSKLLHFQFNYLRTMGDKLSFLKYISQQYNYTKVKGPKV